jgi:hypothetical protein
VTGPNVSVGYGRGAENGSASVEVPYRDGWLLFGHFLLTANGEPLLAEVRLIPDEQHDDAERDIGEWSGTLEGLKTATTARLTARLLREVRLGDLLSALQTKLSEPKWQREFSHPDLAVIPDIASRFADAEPRPGRKGRPDDHYLAIAVRYAQLHAHHVKNPIQQIAQEQDLDESQVRDRIHQARARDLLTPGRRGTAGGVLTAKANELLRQGLAHGEH